MKIEAAVDKMMYGTIKVDIPDEQLRDISKREERAIVWNAVQAAIRNGTPVEWDNITGSVAYHGDYRTIGEEKMERIQENEQWKLDGDCRKCRRAKYCSKPCTRCKHVDQAEIAGYVAEALNNITGGTYEKIMKNRMY